MKNKTIRGYTLIEVVVVVGLIAILAALTVPQLGKVSHRNRLGEVTNLFQRTVADGRALAMQSRLAVVVEVRNTAVWINLLDSPACTGTIRTACYDAGENNGGTEVRLDTREFVDAGVDMCSLRFATVNTADSSCDLDAQSYHTTGGALCFTGSGQLWVWKAGQGDFDAGDDCSDNGNAAMYSSGVWEKACAPWLGAAAAVDADETTWFSGADARFNRFTDGEGECVAGEDTPADAEDVTRRVLIPAGGHPYSKLVESGQ